MTVADPEGVFDGAAHLDVAGVSCAVRVRLSGYLNPVDGRYHWQGLVYGAPEDFSTGRPAAVRIGDRTAEARLVEKVPSGQLMISGVGAPPYELV